MNLYNRTLTRPRQEYNETQILLGRITRMLLGFLFIFSGIIKGIDPYGTVLKVEEYFSALSLSVSYESLVSLVFFLCFAEFMTGVLLVSNLLKRITNIFSVTIMLFMTLVTVWIFFSKAVTDCGCFGDAIHLSNGATLLKNIILLGFAICGAVYNDYSKTKAGPVSYFGLLAIPAMGFLLYAIGNYLYLPQIDMRPYKVGRNIAAMRSIPEGAARDEYSYHFVYQKDGKEKTFSMEEIATIDSTWEFVRSDTKLAKKGYQAPAADFVLYEGEIDVTDSMLSLPDTEMWVISRDAEKVLLHERIDSLLKVAERMKLPFRILSPVPEKVKRLYGLNDKVPMLQIDLTTAKTIIRSNPGFMMIRKGEILSKYSFRDIPSAEKAEKILRRMYEGKKPPLRPIILAGEILLLCWVMTLMAYYVLHRKRE